ncbi:Phage terminase-like protein, large subunit, contains N-terminal HTH domain [Lysinibacillus sp. AC-3]|uniref:terminase large subunit n=1 Tax=unclassified Lysinibacillus TaxID=2636778 RepID=UPI0009C7D1C1|nr:MULTISPECIES: terminase TerL endonuclease subunit [unclassified Lysinibacillus]SKB82932.1 Phage terminase-like protein, large subunit, contains N-terminal HTH domain [Lysinibacillus sp. AC-3]
MAKKKNEPIKIRYPLSYNPVIEYYEKIESGEILVSDKVKKVYKELVRKINDPKSRYEYDAKKANKAIEFVENFCKHSKGEWSGKPVILELWQKALLGATFGMVDKETGYRMIKELVLIIPRKAGKSTLGSGIANYLLIADNEGGSEVYAVSTKKDAAKIVWGESVKMIKKSPVLLRRLECRISEVRYPMGEGVYKPLSSDSNSLDGLNAHGSFMDEIHAWKDKNLYDVIVDSMSTRKQPLNFIMTTAGYVRNGIYDLKYAECEDIINGYSDGSYTDESVLPIIYELDGSEEIHDEEMWYKANPTLGTVKSLDYIRKRYNKAINNPVNMPNLLTKDFNIRHSGNVAWLTYDQVNNEATFDIEQLKPKYGIGGVDMSRTTDLTAACFLFMMPDDDTIYVEHMYWLPEDGLDERIKEDNMPYDMFVQQGHMRLCEGNIINPTDVLDWFKEVQEEYKCHMYYIGYDRYESSQWIVDMEQEFGRSTMIPIAQGAQTLSIPMYNLGALLKKKRVNYNNNPITKWCLHNTHAKVDDNDNIKPIKGENKSKRIDGTASLLDAFTVLENNRNEYSNRIR